MALLRKTLVLIDNEKLCECNVCVYVCVWFPVSNYSMHYFISWMLCVNSIFSFFQLRICSSFTFLARMRLWNSFLCCVHIIKSSERANKYAKFSVYVDPVLLLLVCSWCYRYRSGWLQPTHNIYWHTFFVNWHFMVLTSIVVHTETAR